MRMLRLMPASTTTNKEVREISNSRAPASLHNHAAELGGYGGLVGKVETVAKMNHNGEVNR